MKDSEQWSPDRVAGHDLQGSVRQQKTAPVGQEKSRPHAIFRRVMLVILACAAVAVVIFIDVPAVSDIRRWSDETGNWFPIVFFAAYIGLTQFPIPRTVFTLAAGLLFGPALGILIAIVATGVSAALSLSVVRWLGRDWIREHIRHRRLLELDYHLEQRGWLAVLSLRMIAGVPFSVLNYACALSSIRFWPFALATVVGSAPGTIAVVLLGDALTEGMNPWLVVVTVFFVLVGIAGLIVDSRMPVVERVKANN
ncbi:TVP38/TMEM64 family protein [Corynebacterium sp. H78]|uniref:TVP38/TMEM64 family protein n=1 Tax=Corynebacterium sp. H78 TaxID=3133417 RepID=UPI003099F898